jgi:hypothetical protein
MGVDISTIEGIEIDDRIAHQLSRRVICHVTAPSNLEKLDAQFSQARFAELQMGSVRTPAEGDDRRMFEQQESIGGPSGEAVGDGFVLERKRIGVGNLPQPFDG